MPGQRMPFDEETWQGRSQFAGLFLADVIGHFVRTRQYPEPAIGSRRCLDEELCSDRPFRKLRSCIPQGILLFVWSVKTLSALERAF
jgi:hypothetical protein